MPIISTLGDANIIGNTVSQANLTVLGAHSNLTGSLNVLGFSNLTSLTVRSTANFLANTTFLANTQHLGNTYFGNINSYGTSNLNTLNIAGQANMTATVGITGAANLFSTLAVVGQSNLLGSVGITGASNLLSTLGVADRAWLLSTLNVSANINTASNLSVAGFANIGLLNVTSTSNFVGNTTLLGNSNIFGVTHNVASSNNFFMGTVNIVGVSNILGNVMLMNAFGVAGQANILSTLGVTGQANLLGTVGITGQANLLSTLSVQGAVNTFSTMNVGTALSVMQVANIYQMNVQTNSNLNQSLTVQGQTNIYSLSNINSLVVPGTSNLAQVGIYGNLVVEANSNLKGTVNVGQTMNAIGNISTPANLIIGSNIVPGATGFNAGNVLVTGNLVVQGNIFSTSGALGSIGGLVLTNAAGISLTGPFSNDANGNAFSFTLDPMTISGTSAFISVSAGGNIKFQMPGTYLLTGLFSSDQSISKVAIGTSVTDTHPTTKSYSYIVAQGSNVDFSIPIVVLDQTLYYYIDVYSPVNAVTVEPTYATIGTTSGTYLAVNSYGTFVPQSINLTVPWINTIGSANIWVASSVGIGTVAPNSKLSVGGNAAFGSYGLAGTAAPINGLILDGNVGFGTAAPRANLVVIGNTVVTSNLWIGSFANIGGYANVVGSFSAALSNVQSLVVGFDSIVNRNANVLGVTNLNSTANITGVTNVASSFSAGLTNLQSLNVTTTSNLVGATTIGGTMNIQSTANVNSAFSALGQGIFGGNLGVFCNTAPTRTLDVLGSAVFGASSERLILNSTYIGFNRDPIAAVNYTASAFAYQFNHTQSVTAASDYMAVQVYNQAGASVNSIAFVVNGLGNVGIGKQPATKLDVDGAIAISGTTVIDGSRNLTSIGTVGCGAITSSAGISGTTGSFSGIITLPTGAGTNEIGPGTGDGASYSTYNVYIRTWNGLAIRDYAGTVRMVADARNGVWDVTGGYKINGTTVIDGSRNLTNIGTIGSGAITASTISGTTLTASTSHNTSGSGVYQVAGTTVIDSSRNLTNIGSVGCGAITATTGSFSGNVSLTGANANLGLNRGAIWFTAVNDLNHYLYNNYNNRDGAGGFDGMKWNTYDGLWVRGGAAGVNTGIFMNSSGNVGLGNTVPGYRLHVTGDAYVTGTIRINATNSLYFETYGGGWFMQDTTYIRAVNNKSIYTAGSIYCDASLVVGGATTIDSSRNLVNIGNINTTGSINMTGNTTRIQFNSTSAWSGDAGTSFGKLEYHAQRWYVNAGSNSDRIVQFRRAGSDVSHIDNAGTYFGSVSGSISGGTVAGSTGTFTGAVSGTTGTFTGLVTVRRLLPYSYAYGAGFDTAAIEVREYGLEGATGGTENARAPRIGFHWAGRVASQIIMESSGRIGIWNNPGNNWEAFASGNYTCNGTINSTGSITCTGDEIAMGSFNTVGAVSKYVGVSGGGYSLGGMEIQNTTLNGNWSQKVHFRTHYYGVSNGRRMTINEAGNVGIGNEAPGYKLRVEGDISSTSTYRINDAIAIDANRDVYFRYGTFTATGLTAWTGGPAIYLNALGSPYVQSSLSFFTEYNATSFAQSYITSYNYVTGVSGRLTLRSAINELYFAGYTTNGTLSVNGTTGRVQSSSDARVKSNISYLPKSDYSSQIMKLKPATFTFKTDPTQIKLGFIAQDVEKVIPIAVDGKKYEYEWKMKPASDTSKEGARVPDLDDKGNLQFTDQIRPRGLDDRAILATLVMALQEQIGISNDLRDRLTSIEKLLAGNV
jgi:hypothetical protein